MCEHETFVASVDVVRLRSTDQGPVTGFMADLKIKCRACGKPFQFMGMEAGVDMQGARVSVDGLEARLAITPAGEAMSALDRMTMAVAGERNR